MQEVEFRGKSLLDGKWYYGFYYNMDDSRKGERRHIIRWGNNGPGRQNIEEPVDPESVGQYTGLKDRTGKKIYKGDILELINEDGERVRAVCKFGNRRLTTEDGITIDIQCFYFQIGDRKTNPVVVNYRGIHDLEIMEIRGNTYDDPGLLEG